MKIMRNTREELIDRAKTLSVMPTFRGVIERLFAVLDDRNSSFHDVYAVIKYEQALTAKLISIANSAYYSRGVEIFSLQRAMTAIGLEEVKNIVVCIFFVENMLKELKLPGAIFLQFWKHSLHVACAARLLAERTITEDAQKVFTVALLHDIGKIIFYLANEKYDELVMNTQRGEESLNSVERALFGTDHGEIGYVLSVKWRFPQEFSEVIRAHHGGEVLGKYAQLLNLVKVADRFSTASVYDPDPETLILLNEKEGITEEMEKIMNFLRLDGHGTR